MIKLYIIEIGNESFPTSGAWCENNIYNKLPTAMISIGKAACGH